MNDAELNAAIAVWCGWKFDGRDVWTSPEGIEYQALYGSEDKYGTPLPPNYCNDLNAMHEAEVRMEDDMALCHKYWKELAEATMADDEEEATVTRYRRIGNANARQRAEAFAKTLGIGGKP